MCLTERSQCGTDLGLIKTKAIKEKDGSFLLTGQKIFITSGDHDLTENIIHLVLAKIPGGPAGTKGISLFLVPKFNVNEDGSVELEMELTLYLLRAKWNKKRISNLRA